jgi:hypothetical protein
MYLRGSEGDPESYCLEASAKILVTDDACEEDTCEEKEAGTIRLFVCRLGEAMNDGVSRFDVLDSRSQTEPYLELLSEGDWSDEVLKYGDCFGSDLLVIDRVEVKPEYRGACIGLLAVRAHKDV